MYEFQAFFSYKRDPLTDDWHEKLMERIRYWLSQQLVIPNVPIFFDRRSIDNGALFDQAIAVALKKSTVIISVMSPLYFASAYCLAELRAFTAREDQLGLPRGSLVSCARFHDGNHYPTPFDRMESENFAPFATTAKAFWDSLNAVLFEERIKAFTDVIANKVKASPDWNANFPDPIFDPKAIETPAPIKRPAAYLGTPP